MDVDVTVSTGHVEEQEELTDNMDTVTPHDDCISEKNGFSSDKRRKRYLLLRTLLDGFTLLFSGLQVAQRGPAFLDLQLISGTTVEGASSYVTVSCFGYIVGNFLSGIFIDRVKNTAILVCVPLTVAAFFIGLIPWCTTYSTMLVVHICAYAMCAFPETTVTAEEFHMWHGNSDSALQFLSFTYSLGGFFSPLYTEPFLAPNWNNSDSALSNNEYKTEPGLEFDKEAVYTLIFPASLNNQTSPTPPIGGGKPNETFYESDIPKSQLHYAYLITGVIGVVVAIPFYIICINKCFQKTPKLKSVEIADEPRKRLTVKAYILLTFISSIFYFFFTLTEDSFNVFLSMFVVSHLSWSKEHGALISSLYWGVGTGSKLLMIFLLRRIDTGKIILIGFLDMALSLILFVIASHFHIHSLIWISSACFSLGQAPIFGGGYSWVDSNLFKIDGKATSWIFILANLGSMTGPLIIGTTMGKISMMLFPILELIECLITMFLFIFMFFFLKPFIIMRYGDPKSVGDTDEEIKADDSERKEVMINNGSQNQDTNSENVI